MKDNMKINISEQHIEKMFEELSKTEVQPPSRLYYSIIERIDKVEEGRFYSISRLFGKIKLFIDERKTPVVTLALSIIMIVFLSMSAVIYVAEHNNALYCLEYAMENGTFLEKQTNINNNTGKAIPLQLLARESGKESNTDVLVNGDNITEKDSSLLMELTYNYNNIKVNKGEIMVKIGEISDIIVGEETSFKIDTSIDDEMKRKDIYIKLEKGELNFSNALDSDYKTYYYIETPSSIVNIYNSKFKVVVFDNGDTLLSVEDGSVEVFYNIKWGDNITDKEMTILNGYLNKPVKVEKGTKQIFLMSDVSDYSNYINKHFKRLIYEYEIK